MVYIKSLQLRHFKSFNKPVYLQFGPGLNCVIGANGSGKSNCTDAICFGLGHQGSKLLRADNYSDLVFQRKGVANGVEADVKFSLDNKSKVFPLNDQEIILSRTIKSNGSTQFRINGKNATRQQVVDLLSYARVNPDGHNIILQGDISRFVDMKTTERRQVIEEVAGISIYEERKAKALAELEKIDEKLKEAKIVLAEKETYLKELYSEKQEAERYRSFKQELEMAQATEIKMRMDALNDNRNKVVRRLQKIEEDTNKFGESALKMKKDVDGFDKEIEEVETTIEKKGGEEQLNLQREIEKLRFSIERNKNLVDSSNNEIKRIDTRIGLLNKSLDEINKKISEYVKERENLRKGKAEIDERINVFKKELGVDSTDTKKIQATLEEIEAKLEKLGSQKQDFNNGISKLDGRREFLIANVSELSAKIAEADEQKGVIRQTKDMKIKYKQIITDLNTLSSKDSKLAHELVELRREKGAVDEEVGRLKISSTATEQLIRRDRAMNLISELKRKNKSIIGTIAELGKVPSKFSVALKIAAGSKMKNIVVENEDSAIMALNELKKSQVGTATFLPLNKLRAESPVVPPNKPGVYGLAIDLVRYDKKYESAFRYVFGNTLVVDTPATAKSLGISKYKMVTLEGDSFQMSGAITGGYVRRDIGLGFQESEINKLLETEKKKQSELNKRTDGLELERQKLEEAMIELRREKAELEGRIEAVGSLPETYVESYETQKHDFEAELKFLEKEKNEILNRLKKLDEEINSNKLQRNKISFHLNELQFGSKRVDMSKLESEDREYLSKLAMINAQLDNALLPEQINIQRVLKELEKEKNEFVTQIGQKTSEVDKQIKLLALQEKEEKEAYGKLKQLFKTKSELREKRDKLALSFEKDRLQIESLEKEKNELSIERARLESVFSGIKEELSQLSTNETLKYLESITAAKNKIKELRAKLEGMGNVNLKALDIYEQLKQEYDKLSWRVAKLGSEKEEVHNVINEIEKKKGDSFMNVYSKISESFTKLFERMTDKGTAALELENKVDPFAGGVNVNIKHHDGKHMTLASLSGGEKVLVALAMIFSVQECNPAPFYLFDEIDAALDKVNSEKVANLLKEYSKKAQIIMVTHNDALISAADRLYGVSMNKEGESNVVSLEL